MIQICFAIFTIKKTTEQSPAVLSLSIKLIVKLDVLEQVSQRCCSLLLGRQYIADALFALTSVLSALALIAIATVIVVSRSVRTLASLSAFESLASLSGSVLSLLLRLGCEQSTYGKTYTLFLGIDFENLSRNFLTEAENILNLFNSAVSNLRYVNQTVDRRLELYECAKRSDAYYLARYLFPYDILLSRQIPGLGLELLITEGNFLLLGCTCRLRSKK